MAEYEKKVRKLLHENGCVFIRHGKGNHDIWYSPITNRNISVDSKIAKRPHGQWHNETRYLPFPGIKPIGDAYPYCVTALLY